MQIKLLVEGGAMKPGPALSQQLGPIGVNVGKVITRVNEVTQGFKGLKVPVELEVDVSTKNFEIKVFSPPVSELLKKELGLEKGSGEQIKTKVANASIEQIISVAKTKFPNLLCKNLKLAVKTVVGTCTTLGILVENKNAKEVEEDIETGKYDKEILEEITETPLEKKERLAKYFAIIKDAQEKQKAAEAAAAAAAEAEKEAAAKASAEAGKTTEVAKTEATTKTEETAKIAEVKK